MLRPLNTLNTAARTMWEYDIGCVPVVDKDGRAIGMLTDSDVCMSAYIQGASLTGALPLSRVGSLGKNRCLSIGFRNIHLAILQTTLLGRRLALLAGRSAFSSGQVARLSVLAALHDIGKFNLGFQNKALVNPPFVTGHVSTVLGLFGDDDKPEQRRLIESMRLEVLERWGLGDASLRLLVASICHHGRAVEVGQGFAPRFWQSARGLDPFAGIADLTALTRYWFPSAFNDDVEAFPENSEFQHAFSGLVMLADWLGSDNERFSPFSTGIDHASRIKFARQQAAFALKEVGLDPA